MSEEVLIKVEGLGKKFCKDLKKSLQYGVQDVVRSLVGKQSKQDLRKDEFWALKGINFELKRGECLGLLGHNGAGKSTLLKVLNGLIKPDEGSVSIRGKISALIELGAGFNPVLTGRENIYNNASVLGFTKKEIDDKLEEIIDFSEIREFIDAPVQSYSSGMKVRLGFAVAAQMEPDVLFIDEVLAVGDMGFKLKCLNRIDELMETSAVIFVSHSMPMVSRVCTHAILMDKGQIMYKGNDVGVGVSRYLTKFDASTTPQVVFQSSKNTNLVFATINQGKTTVDAVSTVHWLTDVTIQLKFETDPHITSPTVSLVFFDGEEKPVALCQQIDVAAVSKVNIEGEKRVFETSVTIPKVQFSAGKYNMVFLLTESENTKPLLRIRSAAILDVISKKHIWQSFEMVGEWTND